MRHSFYFILFVVVLSSCGSSCNKDKDQYVEVEFEFAIPLTTTPGTDTITVGQDLTLTGNFSGSLFDVLSQKKYYLPNFNLKTVAVIKKLSSNTIQFPEQPGSVGNFTLTNINGSFSNLSASFADVNYTYQNNRYAISVKLKPLQTGVYGLSFYHSTGTKGQTELPQELAPNEPGIKRFPIMKVIRYTFNNGNTHFNIYKDNCKPADPNEATNWVESKATYTFVVK
jgi:hypothetical protein